MLITPSGSRDAQRLSDFYRVNAGHLAPWSPEQVAGYHDVDAWRARLVERQAAARAESGAYFIGCEEATGRVMAICNLSAVVRGAFQACTMGFAVGAEFEGRGHMQQLCQHVLKHAFGPLQLHRVMANYMPRNKRSGALLARLGFREEGLALKYLRIKGKWENHILCSICHPSD